MNDKTSYPLCWPENYQRTNPVAVTFSRFDRLFSIARASEELELELGRLNWKSRRDAILSTNVRLTLTGKASSNAGEPTDKGVAVYFPFRGKQVSLACDRWNLVAHNIWAIVKHIEALRGQERWGVGSIEQAFRGYMALPERSEASSWWKVLEVAINATAEQCRDAYVRLAKIHHPDHDGDNAQMAAINLAWEEAQRHFGTDGPISTTAP